MSKVNYPDVILFLANYACSNLNMESWREDDKQKLVTDIVEHTNQDNIDKFAAMRTKKDLGGDELDATEIVMELEEEFNVEISDGWLGGKGDDPTMGELAEYVVALRK